MAGLSAVNSKLKYLSTQHFEKVQGKQQSAVFLNDDGSINWPENAANGVLAVPRLLTKEEWIEKHSSME